MYIEIDEVNRKGSLMDTQETHESDPTLVRLKAVADASRLTLLRTLQADEHTVGDLAERVQLSESTVSHHLARLREAGFVTLRMAGNQRFYRINEGGLATFKRLVGQIEHFPPRAERPVSDDEWTAWIAALDWSDEDKTILDHHTVNGRLTRLPRKPKKTLVILRWLVTLFQPETAYTEKQVNAILKDVYKPDFVSLRRDLVDYGYLRRERGGGKYWLAPDDE